MVPLVNVVLSAVPADIAGGASGIFSTAQQFGGALGAAVIGSVFFGALADGGPTRALTTAMPWVSAGFLLCAVLCLTLPRTAVSPEPVAGVADRETKRARPPGEGSGPAPSLVRWDMTTRYIHPLNRVPPNMLGRARPAPRWRVRTACRRSPAA